MSQGLVQKASETSATHDEKVYIAKRQIVARAVQLRSVIPLANLEGPGRLPYSSNSSMLFQRSVSHSTGENCDAE